MRMEASLRGLGPGDGVVEEWADRVGGGLELCDAAVSGEAGASRTNGPSRQMVGVLVFDELGARTVPGRSRRITRQA